MIDAFKHCLDKFQLEQLDTYLFRYSGKNAGIQRIYGGQVIAPVSYTHLRAHETG